MAAHQQGLAIRRLAAATGLSATRGHQLLTAAAPEGSPAWLSQLRGPGGPAGAADEGAVPAPNTAAFVPRRRDTSRRDTLSARSSARPSGAAT